MLYKSFLLLSNDYAFLNVFRYITFRTAIAVFFGFLFSFFLAPPFIRFLKRRQIGEEIREDGPQSHFSKRGTPTMGGFIILLSILISTLLLNDLSNRYVLLSLFVLVTFGLLGLFDDYKKVVKKNRKGLTAGKKFFFQFVIGLIVGFLLYKGFVSKEFKTVVMFPFFKDFLPQLGILFIPYAAIVIVATSNAVNLTDGLDGLAIGPLLIAAVAYLIFSYVAGHSEISKYLLVQHVRGAGELTILCGTIFGAGLGFLWFNAYPAQIFMGDVGSLSLGSILAVIALSIKQEILLFSVCGLFVIEVLSVLIQVVSFKITGKRVFKMAPLHHHFEEMNWPESRITIRFWIVALILALLSVATLKLR